MDINKIKETLQEVNGTINLLEEIIKTRDIGCDVEMQLESEKIKLWALEKQMPKKPKEVDDDYSYFICSECDFTVGYLDEKETHKYCFNCGQRIDWSEWSK